MKKYRILTIMCVLVIGVIGVYSINGNKTDSVKTSNEYINDNNISENINENINDDICYSSIVASKPIIYLYPTAEKKIDVKLNFDGDLFCTYPDYKEDEGWSVIAKPDGTLFNIDDQREYSYLFWEGICNKDDWDLSKGFVVKGENTKEFFQEKLSKMGLIPKEYNEFIVFWLPLMQNNKYNLITFVGEEYEETAPLYISPEPDSILRVFMAYKSLDEFIEIEEQEILPFERKGFTVIEWGGAEVK
ncbi:UNVERIFIED_CONTAM: hypothetical protein Cloal_2215 [Acetivibrio alkalicellulosi]